MMTHNIDIECPECKATTRIVLHDLLPPTKATCPAGHDFTIEANGFDDAHKALEELDRSISNIGRTINFKL